jgi:hypothetical protein
MSTGRSAAIWWVCQRITRGARRSRQFEAELQQAPFEAAHPRRQYEAIDPTNRLVAGELRAALERGAAGRVPDRGRDCRDRGEEAGALG